MLQNVTFASFSSFTAWKVSVYENILVRIFLHSDWRRRDTEYLSVFSPNASVSPYSVRMRENADQNNSKYGHFLRSAFFKKISFNTV